MSSKTGHSSSHPNVEKLDCNVTLPPQPNPNEEPLQSNPEEQSDQDDDLSDSFAIADGNRLPWCRRLLCFCSLTLTIAIFTIIILYIIISKPAVYHSDLPKTNGSV